MNESLLSQFKLHYEYHEDYPEINKAIRRAKYAIRKRLKRD